MKITFLAMLAVASYQPTWNSTGPDGIDRSRFGEMEFSCKSEDFGGITAFSFIKTEELNAHGFYSTSLFGHTKWFFAKDSVVIYQNDNPESPAKLKIAAISKSNEVSYAFDLIYSGIVDGKDVWNFEVGSNQKRLSGTCQQVSVMIPLSEKVK